MPAYYKNGVSCHSRINAFYIDKKRLIKVLSGLSISEPDLLNQEYNLKSTKSFKYVRYVNTKENNGNLAELSFYKKQDETYSKIEGNIISSEAMPENLELIKAVFDNDFNTFLKAVQIKGEERKSSWWIELSFDRPQKIDRFELCPRNDTNSIFKNAEYELFYWDNKWISLGRKLANSNFLSYEVPKGSFYLLRALEGGIQQRIL